MFGQTFAVPSNPLPKAILRKSMRAATNVMEQGGCSVTLISFFVNLG